MKAKIKRPKRAKAPPRPRKPKAPARPQEATEPPPDDGSALKRKAEEFFYRLAPQTFMSLMAKYFRLSTEGWEHIPKTGPVIIAPNHSGFSGLDAMILAHQIRDNTGRQPRILTHHFWFKTRLTGVPAQKLGFIEATFENGLKILKKRQPIVIFPEGELGNFKPTLRAYDLQEFKTGFVRLAVQAQAPIVPAIIIGAEEASINLRQMVLGRFFKGLRLPLPLNFLPLPVKWRIKFLHPVVLPYSSQAATDDELAHELAEEIRERMQGSLNEELRKRKSIFF